jgi:uncharacterized protein (DUF1684 family)
MLKYAFVSRHTPTAAQISLAADQNIELITIGDRDAFTVTADEINSNELGPFDGVVVVHPAAALRLMSAFDIGLFENASRAVEGEKPSFERFHIYTKEFFQQWLAPYYPH